MYDLIETIENLREILRFLIINKELTDTQVVPCNQELDKLLIQYWKKSICSEQEKSDGNDGLPMIG